MPILAIVTQDIVVVIITIEVEGFGVYSFEPLDWGSRLASKEEPTKPNQTKTRTGFRLFRAGLSTDTSLATALQLWSTCA